MEAYEAAQAYILEGMSKEQLEAAAINIFQSFDVDSSGQLDRKEFKECLKAMDLGMTTKEIQYAMTHVDVDANGLVSYAEFLPMVIQIFIETVKDKALYENASAMEGFFKNLFE